MKRRLLNIFGLMMAMSLSFTACTPEDDLDDNDNGSGGVGGKKIAKIGTFDWENRYEDYTIKYTWGSYYGQGFKWSGKKLNQYSQWEINENGAMVEEILPFNFVYGDNGKLTEVSYADGDGQDNYYISYTGNNVSEIYNTYTGDNGSYSGWRKWQYSYSSDGKMQSATVSHSDGGITTYNITWAGDNVIMVQRLYDGTRTYNYTYDSKVSPYTTLPTAMVLIMYGDDFEMLSANNMIMKTYQDSEGYSYSTSYTYTYEGNYPVRRIENSNPDYSSGDYYDGGLNEYYEYTDGTGASQAQFYRVNVSNISSNEGYVRGSGEYPAGYTAVLYAEAYSYSGYFFEQWSDGNTQNPRSVTVNGNATYTAVITTGGGSGSGGSNSVTFNGYTWSSVNNTYTYYSNFEALSGISYENTDSEGQINIPVVFLTIESPSTTGTQYLYADENGFLDGDYWSIGYADETFLVDGNNNYYGDWWAKSATVNVTNYNFGTQTFCLTISATMYDALAVLVDQTSTVNTSPTRQLNITLNNVSWEYYQGKGKASGKVAPRRPVGKLTRHSISK